MSIFSFLIDHNATARIEQLSTARDTSGGTVQSYTVVQDQVPCFVSQSGGSRDGRFGSENATITGTVSGDSSWFARSDVRVYFHTGPVAGRYVRLDNPVTHGPSSPGMWIPVFHRSNFTTIQVNNA
jgi:hypothetical protein